MYGDPRIWNFTADMNMDGVVTISDVWLWFKWLYFYPGDLFIFFLIDKGGAVGTFFEIDYSFYGGVLSGIISILSWFFILVILGLMGNSNYQNSEQKTHPQGKE